MVKTKREYILASAFISGIALGLSLVSLGTTQWVVARLEFLSANNERPSDIKYGLFSGTYVQQLAGEGTFSIHATCLINENVCAYLCLSTSESRQQELKKLYYNQPTTFSCNSLPKKNKVVFDLPYSSRQSNNQFINAGLYLSTIVFLVLSIIFGFIATVLSVWNTAGNPIQVIFSIYGVFIYNLIASVSSMMVLILWGALFGSHIVKNVGFYYTITGEMRASDLVSLGFSYWLIIVSTFLYVSSIVILYLRQYFINQEPQIQIHVTTEEDPGSLMIF